MFKLVSKFKPNGDQPEAIKELAEGIKEGKKEGLLEGKKQAYSNTAINLYKNKIPIDIITASTGITKQELMKLIN